MNSISLRGLNVKKYYSLIFNDNYGSPNRMAVIAEIIRALRSVFYTTLFPIILNFLVIVQKYVNIKTTLFHHYSTLLFQRIYIVSLNKKTS